MDDYGILNELVALEEAISYGRPAPTGQPAFAYRPGPLPILLSAPHGAAHWRDGRLKEEDEYTAAMVQALASMTGAQALYSCYRSVGDPNYDRTSPYKAFVQRLARVGQIGFVLDLHGMSDRHGYGLALGTMRGLSCPGWVGLITGTLREHGFEASWPAARPTVCPGDRAAARRRLVIDHPRFTGGLRQDTVTRFVSQELGLPAVQLEVCTSLRVVARQPRSRKPAGFQGDRAGISGLVLGLSALIRRLAQRLSESRVPKRPQATAGLGGR